MKLMISLLMILAILSVNAVAQDTEDKMDKNIYDIKVKTIQDEEISLDAYKGKVILIVNVASKCGFTKHYKGLQELYEKYKDRGLVVLGFPCNQFGKQEPGTEAEILEFCQNNYGVTFPMFSKINVNGKKEHPLYTYLKAYGTGKGKGIIKWNFTKFLVPQDGKDIKRFGTRTKPADLTEDIEKLLAD